MTWLAPDLAIWKGKKVQVIEIFRISEEKKEQYVMESNDDRVNSFLLGAAGELIKLNCNKLRKNFIFCGKAGLDRVATLS